MLSRYFVETYASVKGCRISITEDIWERLVDSDGTPHAHAFQKRGPGQGWCVAEFGGVGSDSDRSSNSKPSFEKDLKLRSGIKGLTLLKLTQSGWADFIKDEYTMLPDTDERLMARLVRKRGRMMETIEDGRRDCERVHLRVCA